MIWGPTPRISGIGNSLDRIDFLTRIGIYSTNHKMLFIIITIVSFFLLNIVIKKTRIGKAMRAVSQNKEACTVVGIDIYDISRITVAIGVMLAALAGGLVVPLTTISTIMGSVIIFKAFAIVVTGGLGEVKGVIWAALAVGLMESFTVTFLGATYKDAIAFILLMLILFVKPSGIFGKRRG
jgi:branched-chain amino acid transport system permease protein